MLEIPQAYTYIELHVLKSKCFIDLVRSKVLQIYNTFRKKKSSRLSDLEILRQYVEQKKTTLLDVIGT